MQLKVSQKLCDTTAIWQCRGDESCVQVHVKINVQIKGNVREECLGSKHLSKRLGDAGFPKQHAQSRQW